MKKNDMLSLLYTLLTPALLMLLGFVLLVNPDSASALIAKLIGWFLVAVGIGFGISAVVSKRGQTGKGITAVLLVVIGGWLAKNPLMLAAWIGRLVGIVLLIDGVGDFLHAKDWGVSRLFPVIVAVLGVILILLPMTTSRLVFSLCGLVVLIIGAAMLIDRLRDRRRLNPPDDPNIIDAL